MTREWIQMFSDEIKISCHKDKKKRVQSKKPAKNWNGNHYNKNVGAQQCLCGKATLPYIHYREGTHFVFLLSVLFSSTDEASMSGTWISFRHMLLDKTNNSNKQTETANTVWNTFLKLIAALIYCFLSFYISSLQHLPSLLLPPPLRSSWHCASPLLMDIDQRETEGRNCTHMHTDTLAVFFCFLFTQHRAGTWWSLLMDLSMPWISCMVSQSGLSRDLMWLSKIRPNNDMNMFPLER